METTMLRELQRIQRLSVRELQAEWSRFYDGETCRSRNKTYLVKRLCWRVQELAHGGLSDRAKARIDELAPAAFARARTPREALDAAVASNQPEPADPAANRKRDPRLPAPGTIILKRYKSRELRVVVHKDGLELDGTMYSSATALAKAVTGSKSINGWLFLGIAQRKRG